MGGLHSARLHNNSGYCPALSFTKSKADSASALVCGAEKINS
jgi:hypothetical protein